MEQKYFVSYMAYTEASNCIFNDYINTDEEITRELIQKIEDTLIERLNKNEKLESKYFATQIINIIKIS